ncbi:hypothetical protein EV191_101354 [Tamaricihabitans halophyticus]|uniref:Uncharacterized protein n=1 Tax=Tamaricihabitans halophyticus TaxID=1262583 RepID=A0A4R2R9Q2_9PSEU|nr:hypothetical protein [Tamaricihabitans halophyticus]TCP56411.1 hypothetical protein EV191_101354 [Tamaricihabitans halophyticus]
MTDYVAKALEVDIDDAVRRVREISEQEAMNQAISVVGAGPAPGGAEWEAEQGTDTPAARQTAWQLVRLRIELATGIDPFGTVLGLRRMGTTWATIAAAAGVSRQAAHDRWGKQVLGVLDAYGTGELGGPVADDEADLRRGMAR